MMSDMKIKPPEGLMKRYDNLREPSPQKNGLSGSLWESGEDMGVLGGRSPPNTPIFLPYTGDSQ